MTGEVLLLAGLPGSGKTTHLGEMVRQGWVVFDDFKARAVGDSSAFQKSRHFEALVASARHGYRCAVSDVDFCRTNSREEASNVLSSLLPGLNIRWLFFGPDSWSCERNVRQRNRDSLNSDLAKLQEYSAVYHVPEGAEVRPVLTRNG